jgi:hypothetical protein
VWFVEGKQKKITQPAAITLVVKENKKNFVKNKEKQTR